MDNIKVVAPIFIAKTRSFWLGILPSALTLIDVVAGSVSSGSSEPIASGIAAITKPLLGITADQVHAFMLAVAPVCALIVAHQRGGVTRPYTISPSKERQVLEAIQDGKRAFEAGKTFGAKLMGRR